MDIEFMKTNKTTPKHTPEPWGDLDGVIVPPYATDDGQAWIADTRSAPNARRNAARIVACVNACAGINPEAVPDLLRVLTRLAEKVRRANSIQHSGTKIDPEDWSELYQLQNEAFAVIEKAGLTT
jgi:hypothetical protein